MQTYLPCQQPTAANNRQTGKPTAQSEPELSDRSPCMHSPTSPPLFPRQPPSTLTTPTFHHRCAQRRPVRLPDLYSVPSHSKLFSSFLLHNRETWLLHHFQGPVPLHAQRPFMYHMDVNGILDNDMSHLQYPVLFPFSLFPRTPVGLTDF